MLAMITSWFIGVLGLSDAFTKVLFLRDNSLPDLNAIIRGLGDESDPVAALGSLYESAQLHAFGEMVRIAFPLFLGKLILSVLLVITSAMAMSGRPGSRVVTIQAHLAYAALAAASFWLLRDARYAAMDVMHSVLPLLPKLFATEPPQALHAWTILLDKPALVWLSRLSVGIFGIGALLVGALTLMTARTKAFFEAVAATIEDTEDL